MHPPRWRAQRAALRRQTNYNETDRCKHNGNAAEILDVRPRTVVTASAAAAAVASAGDGEKTETGGDKAGVTERSGRQGKRKRAEEGEATHERGLGEGPILMARNGRVICAARAARDGGAAGGCRATDVADPAGGASRASLWWATPLRDGGRVEAPRQPPLTSAAGAMERSRGSATATCGGREGGDRCGLDSPRAAPWA